MRTLRLGVIGCGYWGPNLVRNFSSVPGARVSVVCDIAPELSREQVELVAAAIREAS